MWLAKIVDGIEYVTPLKGQQEAKAWIIPGGAAARSQSREGAIASAKVVLEGVRMKQQGKTMIATPVAFEEIET